MRVILLVIDGLGIGELPDASVYGDKGSNTYRAVCNGAQLPNLTALGLDNIDVIDYRDKIAAPIGCYGRVRELSVGKDTTTGHYEIAGVITREGAPVYPNGFPSEIISKLENAFGVGVIGNLAASGTEIINALGDEHIAAGKPIVYTSADSVLQIAAHESVFALESLYALCEKARVVMTGNHAVSRVIARPFAGERGNYYRTDARKDFSLPPPCKTMTDYLTENGVDCIAVGKIKDIFCNRGITGHLPAHGNREVAEKIMEAMDSAKNALIFANAVDTDMLYGHRNDTEGFRGELIRLDGDIGKIMEKMSRDDRLIITADHGCDPSTESTDHSREYTPLLIYGKKLTAGVNLKTLSGMDVIAHTVLDWFGIYRGDKSLAKALIKPKKDILRRK